MHPPLGITLLSQKRIIITPPDSLQKNNGKDDPSRQRIIITPPESLQKKTKEMITQAEWIITTPPDSLQKPRENDDPSRRDHNYSAGFVAVVF